MYRVCKAKEIIYLYCNDQESYDIEISAKEILLPQFLYSGDSVDDTQPLFQAPSSEKTTQNKLQSFMSTPRFINCLTDLSRSVSNISGTSQYKRNLIVSRLRKMNQFLPAAVYIPFVGSAIRNYAVLHIPVSEVRVFQTKERSPFVICLEVFRPDELNQYSETQKFQSGAHKMTKRVNRNQQINFDADIKASNPIYIRREGSVQRSFVSDVETTQSLVLKNEISRSFSSAAVKSFTTQSDHARQSQLILDAPTGFKQPDD